MIWWFNRMKVTKVFVNEHLVTRHKLCSNAKFRLEAHNSHDSTIIFAKFALLIALSSMLYCNGKLWPRRELNLALLPFRGSVLIPYTTGTWAENVSQCPLFHLLTTLALTHCVASQQLAHHFICNSAPIFLMIQQVTNESIFIIEHCDDEHHIWFSPSRTSKSHLM